MDRREFIKASAIVLTSIIIPAIPLNEALALAESLDIPEGYVPVGYLTSFHYKGEVYTVSNTKQGMKAWKGLGIPRSEYPELFELLNKER